MPIELGKLTETSQLTFAFLIQDYFNLVSIVCIEKKSPGSISNGVRLFQA